MSFIKNSGPYVVEIFLNNNMIHRIKKTYIGYGAYQ